MFAPLKNSCEELMTTTCDLNQQALRISYAMPIVRQAASCKPHERCRFDDSPPGFYCPISLQCVTGLADQDTSIASIDFSRKAVIS